MENEDVMVPLADVMLTISMDVSVEVQQREYLQMTPLQCYEAGVIDAGTAVRKAIREALKKKYQPESGENSE